jgi:hypothetical protein
MRFYSCSVFYLVPLGFALVCAAQEQGGGSAAALSERISITYEKGSLRASIRDCQLVEVLEELAAKAGVAIFPAPGVGQERVSVELTKVSLEEGLRQLVGGRYDTFFYYRAASLDPARLRAVWIYPMGWGITLKPVPPAAWASSQELAALLNDPDPAVREKAYEAMMERPGAGNRDLLLEALRGARETDDDVRARILYGALNKRVPIPTPLLADLATTDRSEYVRWMALNALSQNPAVKPVAERALLDPSPQVQQRARDILLQLEGARLRLESGRQSSPEEP